MDIFFVILCPTRNMELAFETTRDFVVSIYDFFFNRCLPIKCVRVFFSFFFFNGVKDRGWRLS